MPASRGSVEVLRPGLHTTVQDLGRRGLGHAGVPPAGVLDEFAARIANRLAGNPDDAAVLECTLRGPVLRFGTAATLSVVGADVAVRVDDVEPATTTRFDVPAGSVVEVGTVGAGLRCWVAFSGGIDVAPVLGSRSVDTLTGLGGRPLQTADALAVGSADAPHDERALPAGSRSWPPPVRGTVDVRSVAGPQAAWLVERPDVRVWQVSPRSDRTGLRLSGEPLRFAGRTADVPSHGLVAGAVQVPGDGRPIVLLANHQTTGGYPVADVVCAADLPLLAQVRPGAAVRFIPVDVPAARAAYEERVAALLGDVTSAAGDPRDR